MLAESTARDYISDKVWLPPPKSSPEDPFPSQSFVWKSKYHPQKHLMFQRELSPTLFPTRPNISVHANYYSRVTIFSSYCIFWCGKKKIPSWKTKQKTAHGISISYPKDQVTSIYPNIFLKTQLVIKKHSSKVFLQMSPCRGNF